MIRLFDIDRPFSVIAGQAALIVLLLFFSSIAYSQDWINISPTGMNFNSGQTTGGAMEYKAGKLWVGISTEIWMSPDDGVTWKKTNFSPQLLGEVIYEISFYNDLIGLVCAGGKNVYQTTDGGTTWRVIKSYPATTYSAKYINSPQEIVVTYDTPNLVSVSHDGGLTWNDVYNPVGGNIEQVQVSSTGSIFVMQLLPNIQSRMLRSDDLGATWKSLSGRFDYDCNSFVLDACNYMYVINEESLLPQDFKTDIFTSEDGGLSFSRYQIKDTIGYGCGSIVSPASSILYIQTLWDFSFNDGIMRSTDEGKTWKSIGGPTGFRDSRLIAAKDINTIFAAGTDGSIWRTTNSGGDPISSTGIPNTILLSKNTLFSSDTIRPCDTMLHTETIKLQISGCNTPTLVSQSISGTDAADYALDIPAPTVLTNGDSIVISFHPSSPGQKSGVYSFTLSDGRVFNVQLSGLGKIPTALTLASISTYQVDTIGDSAHVPIGVSGLSQQTMVEMNISFDATDLVYLGTTALNGTPLDIPGTTTTGFSRIRIPAADVSLAGPSAIAHFLCYADTLAVPQVRFDMLSIPDQTLSCAYTVDTKTVTSIIVPFGCGAPTLSYFLRHKVLPTFSIRPNPASGNLIIHSSRSAADVTMEVLDQLGRTALSQRTVTFTNGENVVDVSALPMGTYFLKITSGDWPVTLQFVVTR